MPNSQHSFFLGTVFVCLLVTPCFVNANGASKQHALSEKFARELSKNGEVEITTNKEYCASSNRPLLLSQEMSEIVARAIQYSQHIKVQSECQKVATELEYQFCRFSFYSPNKSEQWSIGFTFLGNPDDGKIKIDSIQCFSTP